MTVRINVRQFVKDYLEGVRDKDLLVKHSLSAKDMVKVVNTLLMQGVITKEQRRARKRKISAVESVQEQSFLKSLYNCPVCGHMHPAPFDRCPACEYEIPREKLRKVDLEPSGRPSVSRSKEKQAAPPKAPSPEAPSPEPPPSKPPPSKPRPPKTDPTQRIRKTDVRTVVDECVPAPDSSPVRGGFPKELANNVGRPLENLTLRDDMSVPLGLENYSVTEIIADSTRAATFKAEGPVGSGEPVAVKVFHQEAVADASIDEVVDTIAEFQRNMSDPNVVPMYGSASLGGRKALLYQYLPLDMETVLKDEQEGLPMELFATLLPQIFNGLGYCHMHKGLDDVVRRLPHLGLKPANILVDPENEAVKLNDCGVVKAVFEVRGFKKRLWEEPGTDMGAIAPEAFVMNARSVNPFLADIYALGVLLYKIATGKPPFIGSTVEEYRLAHLKKYPIPPRVHRYDIPLWLDEMIMKCAVEIAVP
ncbi:protein kinase, partial [Thermodesulfobacteriota bacterium]